VTVKVTDSTTPTAQTATQSLSLSIAATYSAVLSWVASTSSDVTGYNVYRSTVSGGSYTKINSSLITESTYTDSTVVSGKTYYYVTTSVDSSGEESPHSNEVQAVIP
jgi:fibronectin type 3 domain-containing protein